MRIFVVVTVCLSSFHLLFAQQPAKKATSQPPRSAPLANGAVVDNVYRNSQLGITYKIRYGWVDRTSQTRGEPDTSNSGQVLLATFERPPEASGDTINSAVIIAAENLSSYPGVKTAADYFEPLTAATASQGFKVIRNPYEFRVGGKTLMRGDFSKELGKLTMYQSSLVMLNKGYAVSFTVIGSSEDETSQLLEHLSLASNVKH
jgi:hypothetical protein